MDEETRGLGTVKCAETCLPFAGSWIRSVKQLGLELVCNEMLALQMVALCARPQHQPLEELLKDFARRKENMEIFEENIKISEEH